MTPTPAFLSDAQKWVDAALEAWLPPADTAPAPLHAAMHHLLFPGGKRLRPALVFAACEAAGAPARQALAPAAAVELLHTYSLIHDDLPCMDDDAERRGAPTVHRLYGEATALLAGDALQALAFEVLCREGLKTVEPATRVQALLDLSRCAGSTALVGGQYDDLHFEPGGADALPRVESIHRRKSAALFACATVLGARFAGAGAAQCAQLGKFGEDLGLAFQIADDLLDHDDGDTCSLLSVLAADGGGGGDGGGVKAARARAETLLERALAHIGDLGAAATALRELAGYALRRSQ